MRRLVSRRRAIPEELKQLDQWVLWLEGDKTPRAPWTTGHMYRAAWGADAGERPETDYETVRRFADMDVNQLDGDYPYPDTVQEPTPTILLPHEGETDEVPLMLVDLDDVRDPDTGDVSDVVADIIERLNAYTEVSSSGEGLHVFVRAELPGELGKFIADLDTAGAIELYDHGRFVGCTWEHVDGTPVDVPQRQGVIDEIVEEYESEEQRERREPSVEKRRERAVESAGLATSSGGGRNPYYSLDVGDIARQDSMFRSHEQRSQGPHPAHGAQSGPRWDAESTNCSIEDSDNVWYCFLHDCGGGPLRLIATMEGVVSCGSSKLRNLEDHPELMLKVCLHARDDYPDGRLDGEKPPNAALVGLARRFDFEFKDDDRWEMTKDTYTIVRSVYKSMSIDDLVEI